MLVGLCAAIVGVAAGHRGAAGDGPPEIFEYELELAVPSPSGETDVVFIRMYAEDPAGGDRARVEAEGRAAMLARFPGATLLEPGEVSAQFKLFAKPVRWPQPAASWVYNPEGVTAAMPAEFALEAITLGAEGWADAGGSGWHWDYLGVTDTPTGCNGEPLAYTKDGINAVGWGHIVGGHLGYSCHWRSASLVPATPYFAIQEIDIIFEPTFPYSAQSLRALALHEFGHALGLDHTEANACPGKAMCAGAAAMQFTTPQQDDIFGVVALYGTAMPPTSSPSPSPSPTPTPPAVPPGPRPFKVIGPVVARD